mgnify:CR=1 FL=1
MSESQSFANYSNTSQRLQQGVNQDSPTDSQITNDKKFFNLQFMVGAGVASKVKMTDLIGKALKNSKTIKNAKASADAVVNNFGEGVKNVANNASSKFQGAVQKVVKANTSAPDVPPPPPGVGGSTEAEMRAGSREGLARAGAGEQPPPPPSGIGGSTEAEMRAGSQEGLARAQLLADRGGPPNIGAPIGGDPQGEASALARTANPASAGEKVAQDMAGGDQRLGILGSGGDNARAGLTAPTQEPVTPPAPQPPKVPTGDGVGDDTGLVKAEKISKDVEKGSGEEDEFDPVGLIVTAIAGIAATEIGRNIKAHQERITGGITAPNSTTTTLGA